MRILFCFQGTKDNTYVALDTDKKVFYYFTGVGEKNPIYVKTKRDIDEIVAAAMNNGYALGI